MNTDDGVALGLACSCLLIEPELCWRLEHHPYPVLQAEDEVYGHSALAGRQKKDGGI